MAYEHKENSGSLFENTRKQSETHSDLTGTINVAGQLYYINAWKKQSEKGDWLSISVKPKF
jgi:hypothetical protein